MFRKLLIAGLVATLLSCSEEPPTEVADLVILGGTIYTGLEAAPTVEAVAVKGNRIVFVGAEAAARQRVGSETELVDLQGAFLYPGFTDAHAHLLGIGLREMTLNLENIASIAELAEAVKVAVAAAEPGQIISGRGWIETHWPEGRFPNRQDLDGVSPDNPVILGRADGHARVANSVALAAAGVDRGTEIPFGGDILKDSDGEPTGMLIDAAMGLVSRLIGQPDAAEKARAYRVGGEVYAASGWTNIHNMGVSLENVLVMEGLSDDGGLRIRVYNSVDGNDLESVKALLAGGRRRSVEGRIVTRAIKLYMDGALGSRGAALLVPYADAETSGLLRSKEEETVPLMIEALRHGIQVNMHAIGDRGNRLLLDWYETAFAAVPLEERKIAEPRWRDEHTQHLNPDDLPRFVALGVIPSMQPSHAIGDLHFAPSRLGSERLQGAYAWRALIDSGVIIAGGTDAPVERGDPRIEFYAAVARQDLEGFSGSGWHLEQAVSRAEALKMFTLWPAIASFAENDLGTIEVGKLADFSVFSKDFMSVEPAEILAAETVLTVVDGHLVYRRQASQQE
jgi:predicted amidohydrolase YtcJ